MSGSSSAPTGASSPSSRLQSTRSATPLSASPSAPPSAPLSASAPTPQQPAFLPVPLPQASRLLNHGPTVLVSSAHAGRRNVMAAAWSMPVEFTPPRLAVVIDKSTLTRELIIASGRLGLCIPGASLIDVTYAVGSVSGRDVDKFGAYGLVARSSADTLGVTSDVASDVASRVAAGTGAEADPVPLIESGCSAWLDCRLIREPHTEQAYDTCFVEVVAAAADPRIFRDGHWRVGPDNADLHTIHHLGGGLFAVAGQPVQARAPGSPRG